MRSFIAIAFVLSLSEASADKTNPYEASDDAHMSSEHIEAPAEDEELYSNWAGELGPAYQESSFRNSVEQATGSGWFNNIYFEWSPEKIHAEGRHQRIQMLRQNVVASLLASPNPDFAKLAEIIPPVSKVRRFGGKTHHLDLSGLLTEIKKLAGDNADLCSAFALLYEKQWREDSPDDLQALQAYLHTNALLVKPQELQAGSLGVFRSAKNHELIHAFVPLSPELLMENRNGTLILIRPIKESYDYYDWFNRNLGGEETKKEKKKVKTLTEFYKRKN